MDRSATDRFNSDEDAPEFHPEAFNEGREAHRLGYRMNDNAANPYVDYPPNHWMLVSFNAGWCDADQQKLSEGNNGD